LRHLASFIKVFLTYENESNNWVFFDDLKVSYTPGNIIQQNDYYPFGLAMSTSWTRETAVNNNYLYNAGSELNDNTQWYEMFFRGYDPALGRMLQIDPVASKYSSVSPYNYAFNDPVGLNDPSGADPYNSNYYNGTGPLNSNAYFYTDMVNADGGFPYRDRGDPIFGNEGLHSRVLGRVNMSWAPDFYGPVYLGQSNYGTAIYGLPSQIERAGGAQAYMNHVNVMLLGVDALIRVGGQQNAIGVNQVQNGRITSGISINFYNTNRKSSSGPLIASAGETNGYMIADDGPPWYEILAKIFNPYALPDAISFSGNLDIVVAGGTDISPDFEMNKLYLLSGYQAGVSKPFVEATISFGFDIGASAVMTKYYYTGDKWSLLLSDFDGFRYHGSIGFSIGIEGGFGISIAPVQRGGYIIGVSTHVGISPPGLSGNIGSGWTRLKK
jgi:RHS repeat-associated protein